MLEILLLIMNVIGLIEAIIIYEYKNKRYGKTLERERRRLLENFFLTVYLASFMIILLIFSSLLIDYIMKGLLKGEMIQSKVMASLFITFNQLIIIISMILMLKARHFISYKRHEIRLNYPSKRMSLEGTIQIGKILNKDKEKYPFYLSLKDLSQHAFITGTTGSGKSNWLQYFIINIKRKHDIPFLLIEFKGEYHNLQGEVDDLLILRVGYNFSINIFDPLNANPEVHAERIYEIFKSGGAWEGTDYSPQMETVFVRVIQEACKRPDKRSWEGFREIAKRLNETEWRNNFNGIQFTLQAVLNRIRRYSVGKLGHIYDQNRGLDVEDIFKYNVLIDLSGITELGGTKEDCLFFLNVLLKYLWDKNISFGSKNYSGIKHISVIEDAQYFGTEKVTRMQKITSYLEDIASLQRGTGECLISLSTRPNLSMEILSNCGVFISFQESIQKGLLAELLNMKDFEGEFLGLLKMGTCLVRINRIGKSFLMKVPLIERKWLSLEEIYENNRVIMQKIRETKRRPEKEEIIVPNEIMPSEKEETEPMKIPNSCWTCGENIAPGEDYCDDCKGLKELKNFINEYIKNVDEKTEKKKSIVRRM